jgi:hypothetical protein
MQIANCRGLPSFNLQFAMFTLQFAIFLADLAFARTIG